MPVAYRAAAFIGALFTTTVEEVRGLTVGPFTLPTRKTVATFGLTFVGVVLFVLVATLALDL